MVGVGWAAGDAGVGGEEVRGGRDPLPPDGHSHRAEVLVYPEPVLVL